LHPILQVGSFWELYWYLMTMVEHNTDGSESARFAVAVMGLTVTRNTKKETVKEKKPLHVGVSMAGPDKWELLLDVGWTVVLADIDTDDNTITGAFGVYESQYEDR
jgi:hypothetical protein